MRRILGSLVVLPATTMLVTAALSLYTIPRATARPFAGGDTGACTAEVTKTVSPGSVLKGERADVTLHVRPRCDRTPLHLVFVLDASNSLSDE